MLIYSRIPLISPCAFSSTLPNANESVAILFKEALVDGGLNDSTLTGICEFEFTAGCGVVGSDNRLP